MASFCPPPQRASHVVFPHFTSRISCRFPAAAQGGDSLHTSRSKGIIAITKFFSPQPLPHSTPPIPTLIARPVPTSL